MDLRPVTRTGRAEEFERVFGERILERYGMTETGMNLTNPYDDERRPGTVGKPFPGQEARVVDIKTREPLSAGEIEVRGPHVFAGYWNRPDATEEGFDEDGWFRTGDLGSVGEDGYFTISGRLKELIIRPRRVVFVDAVPRNALGKVLKHEVRDRLIEPEE